MTVETDATATLHSASAYRRLLMAGFAIVAVVFLGFGSWAALAPLSSAAHAPGVVGVENYRKTVQHLEGGIVKTINVRDGQHVAEGEVVMVLDDTRPRGQLAVLRGQLIVALATEARLVAERDGNDALELPAELLALQDDARLTPAVRQQEQTFSVRRAAQANEKALYNEQIAQLRSRIHGIEAQKAGSERLVRSYAGELDDFRELLAEGYAEKQRVRELERSLAEAEARLGELIADIASTRLQISEARLNILQLEKNLQRELADDLNDVQARLFQLREEIASTRDTVRRTEIRAPRAGVVLNLAIHTQGAVIAPGDMLMDIVPDNEKLIVEARVSTSDIDRVATGQLADIRFPAFKMRDTPRVDGTLIGLSADRLTDPADESRTPYYLGRVEISAHGLSALAEKGFDLIPGMPAEVLINTGARTLLDYLIDPLKNVAARSFIED